MDNDATQRRRVKRWRVQAPAFRGPLQPPTSASCLIRSSAFFAEITEKRIRRGGVQTSRPLSRRSERPGRHTANPKPFRWTANNLAEPNLETAYLILRRVEDGL